MIHFMNYKIYFLRTARNDAINAVIGTVNATPRLPTKTSKRLLTECNLSCFLVHSIYDRKGF